MAEYQTVVAVMAAEAMELWPAIPGTSAWSFAAGLIAGYNLGDRAAASGMLDCGEEDWRRLVRQAIAMSEGKFATAGIRALRPVHG